MQICTGVSVLIFIAYIFFILFSLLSALCEEICIVYEKHKSKIVSVIDVLSKICLEEYSLEERCFYINLHTA